MRHIKYLLTGIAAAVLALLMMALAFGAIAAFYWLVYNQPLVIIVPTIVAFCYAIGADIYEKELSDAYVPERRRSSTSINRRLRKVNPQSFSGDEGSRSTSPEWRSMDRLR